MVGLVVHQRLEMVVAVEVALLKLVKMAHLLLAAMVEMEQLLQFLGHQLHIQAAVVVVH
jgi:hypothetical protein